MNKSRIQNYLKKFYQGEEELTKEMLERIEKKYNDYTKDTLNRILNEYLEARFILELIKNDIEKINPKPKYSEAQNQLKKIVKRGNSNEYKRFYDTWN